MRIVSIRAEFAIFQDCFVRWRQVPARHKESLETIIYALERRMNESIRDTDDSLIQMRSHLEERIEEILTNPLNTVE
jgi:hypothetical protein